MKTNNHIRTKRVYGKYLSIMAIAFGIQFAAVSQTQNHPQVELRGIDFNNRISAQQPNFRQVAILEGHIQDISLLSFSADGLIASVEPNAVIIWQDRQIKRILPGHFSSKMQLTITPTAIAFSPDSRFLATATWSQGVLAPDQAIIVWELETGKPVLTLPGDRGCKQVRFDPTGKILYGACGRGIQAWNFPSGERLFSFASEQLHEAIALSPDGTIMATVDTNLTGEPSNIIQLWQLENQKATLLKTLEGHRNNIARLEFTANGSRLVSSSYDGKIKVWNWKNSKTDISTNSLYSQNGVFSLSANSRLIAGNFGTFSMANLVTGLPFTSSLFPQTTPHALAFSQKLPLLAWGGKPPQFPNPIISLWTEADETKAVDNEVTISASRKGYTTLTLAQYWGENQRLKTEEQISSLGLQSPVGTNIEGMALEVFGLTETVESEQQQAEVKSWNKSLKTVTITQTNLPDDSLTAIRYRVDFAPFGDVTRQQWRVIWAGRQTKCQPNRGHQDWSSDRCQ